LPGIVGMKSNRGIKIRMGFCQGDRPDRCFLVYPHCHHSHHTVLMGALYHQANIFLISFIIQMAVAVEQFHSQTYINDLFDDQVFTLISVFISDNITSLVKKQLDRGG
jgi:hypothetical protein